MENSQKELISQKMALTNTEISVSNARLTLLEYEQQLAELRITQQQTESSQLALIRQNLENVKSAIADWENRYALFSPIDGLAAFSGIWKENQNIAQGQHVMTIVPTQKTEVVGRVYIATTRAGKVKPNQPVNLKFTDFPYREYGMIVGTLNDLSDVPDSVYIGTVFLSDSLVTNYGKTLPFKQNMQGIAEIITEDISLAKRLIYPLKAIFKNNIE
jgi:HlyD family secretion protein